MELNEKGDKVKEPQKFIPIVHVEAMRFMDDADSYHLLHWINTKLTPFKISASWVNGKIFLPVNGGVAEAGDWIVLGCTGEFFVIPGKDFEKLYLPKAQSPA